jgi:hypothetical protein
MATKSDWFKDFSPSRLLPHYPGFESVESALVDCFSFGLAQDHVIQRFSVPSFRPGVECIPI